MTNHIKRKARRTTADKPSGKSPPPKQQGFGFEMPPGRHLIDIYFDQKGHADQAASFYQFYQESNWRSPRGIPYRNWKTLATDWIYEFEQAVKLKKRQAAKNSAFSGL